MTMTEHGELFSEVIGHARELGGDGGIPDAVGPLAQLRQMRPTYEDIFQEILAYDENVRDLLCAIRRRRTSPSASTEQKRLLARGVAGDGPQAALRQLSRAA